MSSYKTIILDFDGVIVESVTIKDKAFEELFKEFPQQLPAIMRYHQSHNAVIRYEKFRFIYENILGLSYNAQIAEHLGRQFSSIVFDQIVRCPFVKGAKEFLDQYSQQSLLYLASVNPLTELRKILEARGLQGYFCDVYAHPWRKTDAIRDILRRNNFTAQEALFIGDSPEDFQASQMAGVDFIARQSNKSWDHHKVAVFADFHGISECLASRMAA